MLWLPLETYMGKVTAARAVWTPSIAAAPRSSANKSVRHAARETCEGTTGDAAVIGFIFMGVSGSRTGCFKVVEVVHARFPRRRRTNEPANAASSTAAEGSGTSGPKAMNP